MARKVSPIPKGYRTATPCLIVNGIAQAVDFYSTAFNAQTLSLINDVTDTYPVYATIKIGNSMIALQQEVIETGVLSPLSLGNNGSQTNLYIEDIDSLWESALSAGAISISEPVDAYWGDRTATLVDPFGHRWSLASRVEHVSSEAIKQRVNELYYPASVDLAVDEIAA